MVCHLEVKGILIMVTKTSIDPTCPLTFGFEIQFPRDLSDWLGSDLLWLKCGAISRELAVDHAPFQFALRFDPRKSKLLIQLLPYFYSRAIYRSDDIERRLADSLLKYGANGPGVEITAMDIRNFRREHRELLMSILESLYCFSFENRWHSTSHEWKEMAQEEAENRVNTARHIDVCR